MTHANTLFYGDNLTLLRDRSYFPDDSVDLVYLDPPFNSNRSYNVLFRDESGRDSDAWITAFEDSWHWGRGTESLYTDLITGCKGASPQRPVKGGDERLVRLLGALVGARPLGAQGSSRRGKGSRVQSGKKGADGGVDGIIHFLDEGGRTERIVVQVKSGKVGRRDISDLRGLLDAGAAIAVFITLEPPTRPMRQEAVSAGYYESELWGRFPRVQILTIADLLAGATVAMPTGFLEGAATFRQAPRARERRDEQGRLL